MFLSENILYWNLWQYSAHKQTTLIPRRTWQRSAAVMKSCMHAPSWSQCHDTEGSVVERTHWSNFHFLETFSMLYLDNFVTFWPGRKKAGHPPGPLSCRQTAPLHSAHALPRGRDTALNTSMFHREPDDEILVQLNHVYISRLWGVCTFCSPSRWREPSSQQVSPPRSTLHGFRWGRTQRRPRRWGFAGRTGVRPFFLIYCDFHTVGGKVHCC